MSVGECHCLCQRWGHLGTCAGAVAATVRMNAVDVPMCGPCAADVRAQKSTAEERGDIVAAIDATCGCQQCGGPLGSSPSTDF